MPSKSWQVLATVLLLSPGFAVASSIQINATCVLGTCPPATGPAGALQVGQSTGVTTGNYLLTFGNGDPYQVSWTFSDSYNGTDTQVTINPTVTYVGVTPSVADDLITFQFFQNFYDNTRGGWNGTYTENVNLLLSPTAMAGSAISAELFYDSQSVGMIGPFGTGFHSGQAVKGLTGLTDPTLAAAFVFNFEFRQGTVNGIQGSAPASAPEPAQMLPVGLAFLGATYQFKAWRRRRATSN